MTTTLSAPKTVDSGQVLTVSDIATDIQSLNELAEIASNEPPKAYALEKGRQTPTALPCKLARTIPANETLVARMTFICLMLLSVSLLGILLGKRIAVVTKRAKAAVAHRVSCCLKAA